MIRPDAARPGKDKADLRAQFLAKRRALSAEEVEQRSQAIAGRFFSSLVLSPTTRLHAFLPIQRQNEVNTWPIIHHIWQHYSGADVAISITNTQTNQLTHYRLTPDTHLTENRWGIPEPSPVSDEVFPVAFDVVLIPLLAFDIWGHRVGYGRGYYDRFLADCRPDCLKIGLSLFGPIERISHVEPTDVRLDACVTPVQTYQFGSITGSSGGN